MCFQDQITLDSFIGQQNTIEQLRVNIAVSKLRNEPLGHMLFIGPRGSGKRSIVNAMLNELNSVVRMASFNEIKTSMALISLLSELSENSILVMEHFEAIKPECLSVLYTALKNSYAEVVMGKGSAARTMRIDFPVFTLVGLMETKIQLPERLIDCFSVCSVLSNYTTEELVLLSERWSTSAGIKITKDGAEKLALYANGSKKLLTIALRRARDFATVLNDRNIDVIMAECAIDSLTSTEIY